MGDVAIDIFLATLKQLITSSKLDQIIDEKHQLQFLEEEIKYLRGFLKNTEKKRNEHSEVMKLVMEIRAVVSKVENIVERFVTDAFKAVDDLTFKTKKRKAGGLFLGLESVKKEIKTLKAKVEQIYNKNIYDINGVAVKEIMQSSTGSGGGSSSAGGRNKSNVVKEKVVVGFDDEVKTLLEKLDNEGDGGLEIITIIGAGGGGKTTLAREVFDHPFTSHTFKIRVWIDVSQDYDKTKKKELLIKVSQTAFPESHGDFEKCTEDLLAEMLKKCLKGKKYLIVMDDVWGLEAWNDFRRSFPDDERNGSKVLFTSRQLVQLDSIRCVTHYLDPLPKHQSWELLKKKVFGMNCCPPKLVDIGMKIAEKCDGLPLAIVTIAGILETEDKTLGVWEGVANHLSSFIAEDKDAGCMEILELSYNHLPLHLKACFLHIGSFREDSEIPVRGLIWLWIAEGFIQQSEEGKSLEAIARDHLIDLVNRSLVMVAWKSSLGGIKACRIHDLLRVFCLKKAEEENFSVHIYDAYSFSPSATNKSRRLFISGCYCPKFSFLLHARNLHSLLFFNTPHFSFSAFNQDVSFFAENFEHLRLLSLVYTQCEGRIRVGHLVHLRYLQTWITSSVRSRQFLESIPNLLNLETLDLQADREGGYFQLPYDIFKMVKLRHLYCERGLFNYHFSAEEAARVGFDHSSKLDSLQTLHSLCACKECHSFLVKTPNLRKLSLVGIYTNGVDVWHDNLMLHDLEFLKFLETLSIQSATLTIGLKLPQTVKRLTLCLTHLKWDQLSIIQNLPSLEVLKLRSNACDGPVWNTSEEGFPQLKCLHLFDLDEIKEWKASEDQFPKLQVLVLGRCKKLERIPIDFNLNELRTIKVVSCTQSVEELARNILEEQRKRKEDDYLDLIVSRGDESG